MAECLPNKISDKKVNCDTDDEDDYEEFCENFTFSVSCFSFVIESQLS